MGERPEGLEAHREEARAVFDPPEPDPRALDAAIDRATAAGRRFARHHERLLQRLTELESTSLTRALMAVRNRTRLPAEEVVPVLVRMAERNRLRDREACRQWAELAVQRAEQGLPETDPFRARAWAELGNAQRIAEQYPAARRSFHRALELIEAGGGRDPGLRGEVYSLLASLENALHRPEQALEWLDQAARCFRRARLPSDLHKVLLKRANVRVFAGDFRQAHTDLQQLLTSLASSAEPPVSSETVLATIHGTFNLVTEVALTSTSVAERKQILAGFVEAISEVGNLYERAPASWRPRRPWMIGRLLMAEQSFPDSRRCFKAAMQEFLDLKQPTAAAVVALDLALAYARDGKAEKVREVAAAACIALKSAGLASDTWATHRTLLDCDVSAMETTILDGLKKLRGASLRRTPGRR